MGFFGKIKNILFEEDEEEEMPVYTKEEVKKEEKIQEPYFNQEVKPATELDDVRYTSFTRDIDANFDNANDNLEITNTLDIPKAKLESMKENSASNEKKSPFLSFDEDEFERLNSRININEKKIKKAEKVPQVTEETLIENKTEVRKANNNFSSVNMGEKKADANKDRYKINSTDKEKKPFTPSPVISPVYGILNKNYKKDEIIDKKDGIKREKLVKDVHHAKTVEVARKDEYGVYKVDIDSVRKKAFGGLNNLEKSANLEKLKNDEDVVESNESTLVEINEIVKDLPKEVKKLSVEEELDANNYEETTNNHDNDVKDYSSLSNKEVKEINEKNKTKPKALDELEKTSTLQILDDIEKELNSIKPKSNDTYDDSDRQMRDSIENSDTLENDLFNLIDSMYENDGEEEEDA